VKVHARTGAWLQHPQQQRAPSRQPPRRTRQQQQHAHGQPWGGGGGVLLLQAIKHGCGRIMTPDYSRPAHRGCAASARCGQCPARL
jgi:hypothetical protein